MPRINSDEVISCGVIILALLMVLFLGYQINHIDHSEQQRVQIVKIEVENNGYTAEVVADKGRGFLHLTLDQANILKVGDFVFISYDCYGSGATGNLQFVKKLEK